MQSVPVTRNGRTITIRGKKGGMEGAMHSSRRQEVFKKMRGERHRPSACQAEDEGKVGKAIEKSFR